jgi:hypothetical protein
MSDARAKARRRFAAQRATLRRVEREARRVVPSNPYWRPAPPNWEDDDHYEDPVASMKEE